MDPASAESRSHTTNPRRRNSPTREMNKNKTLSLKDTLQNLGVRMPVVGNNPTNQQRIKNKSEVITSFGRRIQSHPVAQPREEAPVAIPAVLVGTFRPYPYMTPFHV